MADYVVAGAGSTEVNGTYVENGTHNGKPAYDYSDYRILYGSIGNKWGIYWDDMDDYVMSYYYTNEAGDTPPASGWTAAMGSPPVPTVELDSGNGDGGTARSSIAVVG